MDGIAFGREMTAVVKDFMARELAPLREENAALIARVAELEARQVGPSEESVRKMIADAVAALPVPKDGRDADPVDMDFVAGLIIERVALAIPADDQPPVTLDAVNALIAEAVAALPAPKDGRDADPVDMHAVGLLITEAVAALPRPKDGESVTVDDVAPLIAEAVARAVEALPAAPGFADALIDRDQSLVLTMTDGRTKSLGRVVGKDCDEAEIRKMVADAVAAIPRPKDGRDGFGLDDFDATISDDGRTLTLAFEQGETRHEVKLAMPTAIYRGVWREGDYQRGDMVTWAGSLWHCDAEKSTAKPGGEDWTLAVKKGRDGRDAGKA